MFTEVDMQEAWWLHFHGCWCIVVCILEYQLLDVEAQRFERWPAHVRHSRPPPYSNSKTCEHPTFCFTGSREVTTRWRRQRGDSYSGKATLSVDASLEGVDVQGGGVLCS